jgi:hypothetical protein
MKKLFLVGLLAVAAANATITPDLVVSSPAGPFCSPGPDTNCTYEYEAYLPEKHYLVAGDYFTIYDFAGFVVGSEIGAPANWSGSAQLEGVNTTTPVVVIPDSTEFYNITWTYNGPRIDAPVGGITFDGFTAISELNGIATGWYAAQTHKNTGTAPGTGDKPDANGGLVDVPGPDQGSENPVPEPMSMMLIGGGLSALGMLRLRKK